MSAFDTAVDRPTTPERSVTREIEIAADVDIVWRAITDAEELMRWFPLEARVTPGVGGSVWMRWDAEVPDTSRITVWEPGRRLRLEDVHGAWAGITTEYTLGPSTSGSGTILRVVSSGFGEGDSWDNTVDAFGRGWDFELRGLRHYLERHHGSARRVLSARASYTVSNDEAMRRITGLSGWLGLSAAPRAGEAFEACTATGQPLSGSIEHVTPMQLVAAIDQWNGALLRVQLYAGWARIWIAMYGVADAESANVARDWQTSLESVLSGAN